MRGKKTPDAGRQTPDRRRGMSERINSFKELRVYKKACCLDVMVFEETKK